MRGQNPAPIPVLLLLRLEHNRARPVAEQDAGRAIAPVKDARESLRANDQGALEVSGLKKTVRGSERKDEARAYGLQIERRAVGDAEAGLDRDCAGRKGLIRRRGP